MSEIKDPKITNAETEKVLLTEVKEDPLDSIEARYRERLYFFRYVARYVILFLATAAVFVLGFRYLHLINSYEKMTDLYLANKDWQIIVIYALSLAFTAGLIVSVIAVMVQLVRKKKVNGK